MRKDSDFMAKKRSKNIIKYRKPFRLNVGLLLFLFLFLSYDDLIRLFSMGCSQIFILRNNISERSYPICFESHYNIKKPDRRFDFPCCPDRTCDAYHSSGRDIMAYGHAFGDSVPHGPPQPRGRSRSGRREAVR